MKKIIQFIQNRLFVKRNSYSVKELLISLVVQNSFLRYDVIIRLLAIENHYNKNNYGWMLYEKLRKRQLQTNNVTKEIIQFRNLIYSYEKYGYDSQSEIFIDKRKQLVNGSHRLALALYHGYTSITCRIIRHKATADYSLGRLKNMGFTDIEMRYIIDRYNRLKKVLDEN